MKDLLMRAKMKKLCIILCFFLLANLTYGKTFEVLVLEGNISHSELPALEKFEKIGDSDFNFSSTSDRTLPNLEEYDILWIGQGEICENAYSFNAETEDKIKSFVENGGIVITVGQDSDTNRPCEVGWIPANMTGVERGGVETFQVTDAPEVNGLFSKPNEVTQAHFDDAWTQPDPKIILLATITGGQDVGIGLLIHGSGAYIVTSIENENAADVAVNTPIMENLLNYATSFLPSILSVEPNDKLPLMWANIKIN